MNNLSLYCGLVDAKIRASDKDLPVPSDKNLPLKIGPLSSNNDNVPSADDLAQPASINSSNHNSTTAAVATSAKIEIPAKIQNHSDKDSLVSSSNLHHFDNFSLKRNHNIPGKQTDFLCDF